MKITRTSHPFRGLALPVLNRVRRRAAPSLLLLFPDGSKRIVPVEWTDAAPQPDARAKAVGVSRDVLLRMQDGRNTCRMRALASEIEVKRYQPA